MPSGLAGYAVPQFVEQPHRLSRSIGWSLSLSGARVELRELGKRVHDVRAQDERVTVGLQQA